MSCCLLLSSLLAVLNLQQGRQVLPAPCAAPKHITIDAATGTVTRGPRMQPRAPGTVYAFANLDATVFSTGSDVGGGASEWFMAGTKGNGGVGSSWMTSFQFVYCTSALDPASGGPGASVRLGLYEGYHIGGGAPTTAVAILPFQGLPGRPPSVSSQCYFVHVEFEPAVSFANGPVGFSWLFADLGAGGQAATVPFLACVQSCEGPGPDGQGMVDRIDRYSPPGTLVSSESIAPFASSMALAVGAFPAFPSVAEPYNGEEINADVLSQNAILMGRGWTQKITIGHDHGSGGPMLLRVRTAITDGPNVVSPVGGRLTEVLITGPLQFQRAGTHSGVRGSFGSIDVPVDVSLAGLPWAAQAFVAGGGYVDLSTARHGVVGVH